MKKTVILLCALWSSAVLMAQDSVVSVFPWSEGFETTQVLSGWTLYDFDSTTSDNWTRYSGYTHAGNYCVRSGYNSSAACNDWLVTPPLRLPSSAEGFELKWWVRGSTYSGNQAHYTVLISTSGVDTASFTDTLFAESYPTTTYVERSASLELYAGQTVYIAFIHDSYNDNSLCLDDISVSCTLVPEVSVAGPALAYQGVPVGFRGMLQGGSLDGISYLWESTMATAGLASLLYDDDSVTVDYLAGGIDTLTLTVSNYYGSASAIWVVRVCGTVNTFPWAEGFEDAQRLACWSIYDFNSSTSDNWTRYSSNMNSHTGGYSARSNYNSNGNNEWLVTPAVELPYDAEGFVLKWWVKGSTYSGNQARYTVLVSTAGTDTASFSDTLFSEFYGTTAYAERTASLEDYAGQTIYIAFIHDAPNDNGLYLDDISIYSALPPVAVIAGPAVANEGQEVGFKAVVTEGSVGSATYTWLSTMFDASLALMDATGDSVTMTYSAAGTDTLRLVVDNGFGIDTAMLIVQVCGSVATFPWLEDFSAPEAIGCWTVVDGNAYASDDWRHIATSGFGGGGCAYSSYPSYDASADWLITPPLLIPADAEDLVFSWMVRGTSYGGSTSHYTVLLSTAGTDTASFTDTLFAESYSGSYASRQVPLDGYAGQTVHVAFVHDSYDDDGLYLDDISIRAAVLPVVQLEGPVRAFSGEPVVLVASLVEGSTSGLSYAWSNTLGGTLVPNMDTLTVVYPAGGTDTLRVIATNAYGSDTAYHVLTVVDCPVVDTFPWEEGFEEASALDCWITYDFDGSTSDNWMLYTFSSGIHSGDGAMRSYYNISAPADDWLVTPALSIPDSADGFTLTWWVKGTAYSTNLSHYTVLLSTAGIDTASFADTLFAEAYSGDYSRRAVSFEDYAGQTVRIAFVHDSYNDNGLYLDDIAVRPVLLPVASISGPTSTFTGMPTTFTASLAEGSPTGLAFSWANTLAGSTLNAVGDSLTVLYSAPGTDTLVLSTTNAYGSASDTLVVHVIDCTTISSFPWNEGFEAGPNALQCWTLIDNNSFAADNWLVANVSGIAYEGQYCLGAPYRENGASDDYIVSPPIQLPADATGFRLSYYVAGGQYGSNVTTYQTLVSTTGIAPSDFTDTLVAEAYAGEYALRSYSLAPYAGQTIHFAFHNVSYNSDNLLIDNISVGVSDAPQPDCATPEIVSSSESESQATIVWTGDAFAYQVAIVEGSWTAPASGTTVLTTTYTFLSLNPATTYTAGIRAQCVDGTLSDWATTQFTTASLACSTPTNVETAQRLYTEATITWEPTGDETAWEVNLRAATLAFDTIIESPSPTLTVDHLIPSTTYSVTVRALCNAGSHSHWSPATSFTTLACTAPTGLLSSAVTDTSATLTWNSTGAAFYEISYSTGTNPDQGTIVSLSGTSLTLSDLTPATTYNVYVRAACSSDLLSPWSNRHTFTTTEPVGIDSDLQPPTSTLTLHPNPARTSVTLNGLQPGASVSIVDLHGREVAKFEIRNPKTEIDVASLPRGAYLLRITSGRELVIRRLILE